MLTRTRKAFTLLELIVVIVVLGILALIAVPTFRTVITNSAQAAAETTAGAVARNADAIAAFSAGNTTGADVELAATEAGLSPVSGSGQIEITVTQGGSTGTACVSADGTGLAVVTAAACS